MLEILINQLSNRCQLVKEADRPSPLNVDTKSNLSQQVLYIQSVPYLSAAQQHEGQTDTEDKHPCFPHLGLQLYFMAVPTSPSVLLYLSALHNTDAYNS